jgi:hydroxymethylpyrimidine/phosphomethylpyrimidine kinase
MSTPRPLVLCLSGHDPTGGAGVQADIETCATLNARALSVITALTEQDTNDVRRVRPIAAAVVDEQLRTLLKDCRVDAVKIGLLGSASQVEVIARHLRKLKVTVILDPVLRAGGGRDLASRALQEAVLRNLLPLTTVLTPNASEARRLCPQAPSLPACARALLARGAQHALITGGDEPGNCVTNTWYGPDGHERDFNWPRLPATFHGAGCTLASAIAACLANGLPMAEALEQAQRYTESCLREAVMVGRGRPIPGRLP